MSVRAEGLKTKISLGILDPLVTVGEEMAVSIEQTGKLEGSLGNLGTAYKNLAGDATVALGALAGLRLGPLGAVAGAAIGYSIGHSLTKSVDDQIIGLKRKIKKMEAEGFLGKMFDDLTGEDINLARNQLDSLLKVKKELQAPVDQPKPSTASNVNQKAIDDLLKLGDEGDKAAKKAESAAESLAKKYEDSIVSLQREIALRGDNSEAAKMEYEVISGAFSGLAESQKLKLLQLAAEKDGIELNKKAYEEYDQVIADGIDLAKKQRTDMAADFDRLNQKFNGPLLDLNKGIADAMDARAQGIIPDDEKLKIELDKMGKEYNRLTSNAEDATGQMSEFSVQAAHNMQSAFADFLFDPFKDGVEGMGMNFLKIIQRMTAEAASAQIFNALLGKNFGTDNATGGLLQAGATGVMTLLGGYLGGGAGVSVSAGNSEAFTSMMNQSTASFWSGPSFAYGGNHAGGFRLVGENGPELEYTGPSHIFNANQTRALLSPQSANSGNISITTQVNVTGGSDNPNQNTNQNMQSLGSLINNRVKQIIVEEKRPGGLLS